jgi:hypothetical protein
VSTLLQAPADRPAGKRGLRGTVAAVATIAALVTLVYGSRWDMPAWGRGLMLAAGAGLIGAALLLWTARRPAALALAAALTALAVPPWVIVESHRQQEQREAEKWGGMTFQYDDRGPMITEAQAEAVPKGATKDEVKAILGPAAGSGVQHIRGDAKDLLCLIYRDANRPKSVPTFALCFTGNRYTHLLR